MARKALGQQTRSTRGVGKSIVGLARMLGGLEKNSDMKYVVNHCVVVRRFRRQIVLRRENRGYAAEGGCGQAGG